MPPVTKTAKKLERPAWQEEMLRVAVLYRLAECKQVLPLLAIGEDHEFIDLDLSVMSEMGLLDPRKEGWTVTAKGREVLAKIVAMFDQALKFEIFGGIELTRELKADECQEGDPFLVLDYKYDPRFLPFGKTSKTSEDLRIAMMTFLAEQMAEKIEGGGLDPHRVVFLQKLASGRLKSDQFWFDLRAGTYFKEVEEIVAAAYQWRDISGDEESAANVMRSLYQSGMMEQRKRDGFECSACKIPLGVFQMLADDKGEDFDACPNPDCGVSFKPPPPAQSAAEYECPACKADVYVGDRTCRGCGARIDYSMPAGSVDTVTTSTTTTETYADYVPVWGGYASYGYVPYGYYDPWDPFVDVLAFGCLCAILW